MLFQILLTHLTHRLYLKHVIFPTTKKKRSSITITIANITITILFDVNYGLGTMNGAGYGRLLVSYGNESVIKGQREQLNVCDWKSRP